MNDRIIVLLSKKKNLLALIGSVLFVLIGYLMAVNPQKFISFICGNTEVIRVSGIMSVVFFGLCSGFICRKLFDNKPALIIDQYGITNNTNAASIGLVEWNDITRIEKRQIMSTAFLILHTNKPEKYINRAKNIISRQALYRNYKTYGSPISIISNSLKINFDDLQKIITTEFEKRK